VIAALRRFLARRASRGCGRYWTRVDGFLLGAQIGCHYATRKQWLRNGPAALDRGEKGMGEWCDLLHDAIKLCDPAIKKHFDDAGEDGTR